MTLPHVTTGQELAVNLISDGDYQFAVWYSLTGELRVGRIQRGVHRWGINHQEYEFAGAPRTTLALPVAADEHNYPAVAVDGTGKLWVWANMHNNVLRAVKSTTAHTTGDWLATAGWTSATGDFPSVATRCTYPYPVRRPDGSLWFYLRNGDGITSSGNSDSFYWTRTAGGSTWSARAMLLQGLSVPDAGGPGIPGGDQTVDDITNWNGYPTIYLEPPEGPYPGRFHMAWAWREVPTAEVNVLPAYGYSDDGGVTWKAVDGSILSAPIHPLNSVAARIPGAALIRNMARTANVVTAEVDTAAHGIVVGNSVRVLAQDSGYDGTFTVASVLTSPPRVTWSQTAADDAAGGVGSVGRVDLSISNIKPCVDALGRPHVYVIDMNNDKWQFYYDGTTWIREVVGDTLAGFTQVRPSGCLWFQNALWVYGLAQPPNTARRGRLWRVPSSVSVCLSGDLGHTADYSISVDPEAWRLRASVEVLAPDGDSPRVYTFGRGPRFAAA